MGMEVPLEYVNWRAQSVDMRRRHGGSCDASEEDEEADTDAGAA